jgi:hypothetical protein
MVITILEFSLSGETVCVRVGGSELECCIRRTREKALPSEWLGRQSRQGLVVRRFLTELFGDASAK